MEWGEQQQRCTGATRGHSRNWTSLTPRHIKCGDDWSCVQLSRMLLLNRGRYYGLHQWGRMQQCKTELLRSTHLVTLKRQWGRFGSALVSISKRLAQSPSWRERDCSTFSNSELHLPKRHPGESKSSAGIFFIWQLIENRNLGRHNCFLKAPTSCVLQIGHYSPPPLWVRFSLRPG